MKEGIIQKLVIGYLSTRKDLLFQRTNNIAVFDPVKKIYRSTPPGFKKGYPDITIIKDGKFIGVELKGNEKYKKNGKVNKKGDWKQIQSPEQIEMQKAIKKNGGKYFVIRSVKELEEALDEDLR